MIGKNAIQSAPKTEKHKKTKQNKTKKKRGCVCLILFSEKRTDKMRNKSKKITKLQRRMKRGQCKETNEARFSLLFFSNFDIAHDRLVESSQHHRKTLIICHKAIYILHTFFSISFRSVTFLAGNTQKNKNKNKSNSTGTGRGKREKNRPRTQRLYRFECTSTIQRFIKRTTREMKSKKISRDSYTFAFHSESIWSLDIDCILECDIVYWF